MFLGTYQPNLIGKGRIALPKKIRREVTTDRVILTIGFEKCIFGFEEKAWVQVTEADLARPLSDELGRNLRRKMFSQAQVINLDSQGRLVIPQELMIYADIKDNLVIIGAGDHFEIWNQNLWTEYQKKLDKI